MCGGLWVVVVVEVADRGTGRGGEEGGGRGDVKKRRLGHWSHIDPS